MMNMTLLRSKEDASYRTPPWSSIKCFSTGINNHGAPLGGMSRTSAECDMSIPSTVANDAASFTKTSILSLTVGHSNIDDQTYKHTQAPLLVSNLSIPPLPVHGGPEMDSDEDQAGDILPAAKTFNNNTERYIHRELCLLRVTAAQYQCATQTHGCAEIRIGWDGKIPRWRKGSELSYVVCVESFPSPLSSLVEDSMKAAIDMWGGINVRFKQVARHDPATFAVIYENRNRNVYACSFFPNDSSRELTVYPPSLREPNYLANILAHEVGHILGLRHEFAHEREKGHDSVLFGSENADSIMNYFDHPKQLQVREQDLEELERFYAYDKAKYGELSILDVNPEVWSFSKIMKMNYDTNLLPELR